jgi:hypothetical protein
MVALTTAALLAAPAFADILVLKDGTRVSGYFEGGTARVVKFRGSDGSTRDYDILQVQQVLFESAPLPPAPPAATVIPLPANTSPAPTASSVSSSTSSNSDPVLRPASERPPAQPPVAVAANTGYTVPTGSKLMIQLVDAVNSDTSKEGSTFVAILDEPLLVDGIQVAPRGADVRGRITTANEAGKISGMAELGLELTQICVNGIPYALSTSE